MLNTPIATPNIDELTEIVTQQTHPRIADAVKILQFVSQRQKDMQGLPELDKRAGLILLNLEAGWLWVGSSELVSVGSDGTERLEVRNTA